MTLISISISGFGGVLLANEIAGTKDQSTIVAIEQKHESSKTDLINTIGNKQTEIDNVGAQLDDYKNNAKYQNNKGQILYQWIDEVDKLESQKILLGNEKTNLEDQLLAVDETIKTDLKDAGVYDKVGLAMESKATKLFALGMAGGQILIDLFVYLCLSFIVKFEVKVGKEEGVISQSKPNETQPKSSVPTSPLFDDIQLQSPILAEKKPQRQIGFFKDETHTQETQNTSHNTQEHLKHNVKNEVTQNAESIVAQQSQEHTQPQL